MLLVAALFLGPLVLAAWMYFGSALLPAGSTNKGALLQPIVNLVDTAPDSALHSMDGPLWRLLYRHSGDCDDHCATELQKLRQIRLMLGKDMDRAARVFLHDHGPLATVPDPELLDGLTTITDTGLSELLLAKKPENLVPGGIFLIDPLGNLVMYFPPTLDPGDVVADIKHLLRLSNIG